MSVTRRVLAVQALASAALLLIVTGCGTSASGPEAKADTATAEKQLTAFRNERGAFPVDQRLSRVPASDATYAYLQCVSPVCGLVANYLKSAADTMGVKFTAIKAGASVSDQQAAMDSIIALKPTAVFIGGIEPTGIGSQLKTLSSLGVAVGSIGVVGTDKYGIQAPMNGSKAQELYGQTLAAHVVAKMGANARTVIYEVPEISFSPEVVDAYLAEMKRLCPGCSTRTVNIPVTSIGSDAPSKVVSDLQAHPEDTVAVFSLLDAATGLPAALDTADIHIQIVGHSPSPSNLQDIKSGKIDAATAVDIPVMVWTAFDAVTRVVNGEELTPAEKAGIPPVQLIEQKDITFDPAKGFASFPDYKTRFEALWTTK